MNYIRVFLKITSISFILIFFTFTAILINPLRYLSQEYYLHLRSNLSKLGYSLICSSLGVKISTYGHPPNRPFILVSNHLSFLDIPLLGSLSGGVFLSKQEIRHIPVLGFISNCFGNIFIDRDTPSDSKNASSTIVNRFCHGDGIIIFPEGTTSDGNAVQTFRSSVFYSISSIQIPVHYAAIKYDVSNSNTKKTSNIYWNSQPTLSHYIMYLLSLSTINARVKFGNNKVTHSDRKILAKNLESKVIDAFCFLNK